jgi:hypothetical protein
VLAQGDSWFAHPIQWNILFHLSAMGGYAIRRVAPSVERPYADLSHSSINVTYSGN